MMGTIIAAAVTGVLSFLGVVFTNLSGNRKMQTEIEKHQAVTDTKIEELTREVRLHNNFAQRIPVLENKIKVEDHRIDDLERKLEK